MEILSDEELEWREEVARAERADFERRRYANRPLWQIIFGQILLTSWQITVGCLVVGLVIYLMLRALMRSLVPPYMPT